MKVMFSPSTNYQAKAYQPQNVAKCQNFKGDTSKARVLADSTVEYLLGEPRGEWQNRLLEIRTVLMSMAKDRLNIHPRGVNLTRVLEVLQDTTTGHSLPERIYRTAKVFTGEE